MLSTLRADLLRIAPSEVSCVRRRFHAGDVCIQEHIERIGLVFLGGYSAALEQETVDSLAHCIGAVDEELRGFAVEGAAMGLALLDQLTPWCAGRLRRFIDGPASAHVYMAHVGAGWVIGRLPWRPRFSIWQLDPLLSWLAIDGYGFHEGYFHHPEILLKQRVPTRVRGYERHVFDQGLGRSLWFVKGADAGRIAQTIQSLAPERHGDLWSGVGLACAYAGGADKATLMALRSLAGAFLPHVAQGAAFAAAARARAFNPTVHTELACRAFARMSATEAAAITQAALINLPDGPPGVGYATWRRRIRAHFA